MRPYTRTSIVTRHRIQGQIAAGSAARALIRELDLHRRLRRIVDATLRLCNAARDTATRRADYPGLTSPAPYACRSAGSGP